MGEMAALPRGGVAGMVRFREEASPALGLERLPGSWGADLDGVAHLGASGPGTRAPEATARQEISGCRVACASSRRLLALPLSLSFWYLLTGPLPSWPSSCWCRVTC
jgi:hypothetical protein